MDPNLRNSLLPVFSGVRGIAQGLGLRRYSLTIRTRTWSGGRPGLGTASDSDVVVEPAPRVQGASARNVAFSPDVLLRSDWVADKITPFFAGPPSGGYTMAQLRPTPADDGEEILYILTSADDGEEILCELVDSRYVRSMGIALALRERREQL